MTGGLLNFTPLMPQGDSLAEELSLKGCRRLFIDGGSNQGGGVEEFYKGSYYRCAISAPARLYGKPWHNASRQVKQQWTQPLASSDWCVRSFEANPKLLPMLQRKEREHRSQGRDVRFIDGVLGTVSGSAVPRTIVTYSKDPAGSGASRFDFRRVHGGSPPLLSSEEYLGRGYDIREIIRRMHELNPTAQVALRLDVEGDELFIHKALLETAGADLGVGDGSLLCHVDWMFTEHHNLHVNLTEYGLPERGYNVIGDRIHDAMNTRGCEWQPQRPIRAHHSATRLPLPPCPPKARLKPDCECPTVKARRAVRRAVHLGTGWSRLSSRARRPSEDQLAKLLECLRWPCTVRVVQQDAAGNWHE